MNKLSTNTLVLGFSGKKISTHTHKYIHVTHTRHPDYLSRTSQHARGATKNTDNVALTEIWLTMLADCMQETADAVEGESSSVQRR